jgi:hypothetical protein
MKLIASTFSGNFSFSNTGFPDRAGGGGVYNSGSNVTLRSVIVSGNTFNGLSGAGCDLRGSFNSQGYNLIGNADGSSGFTNGVNGDLTGTSASRLDAQLGALKDNGGPTWTMALLPSSLALNHGDDALLTAPFNLTEDERGLPRKSSAHIDIGAYELQAPNLVELRRSGSDIAITFTTEGGRNYRLERTPILSSDSWTSVADNLAGTGGTVQVLDSDATNQPQYFYRAVMWR